jgi:PTH1 family peptidyl-tRNA hydrolase
VPGAMLIVGLGNPGREYLRTRHNVGFMAVDALARRFGFSFNRKRSRAEIAEGMASGRRVVLAKPQTFMNDSGDAVRPLLRMSNLPPANLVVVHDDLDLPFGRLRLRDRGSAGGHRGMQSIISQLATDQFLRLKVGIGRPPPGVDPIEYVLTPFTAEEQAELRDVFDHAVAGIETLLSRGLNPAFNAINMAPVAAEPLATSGPSGL